ncbi:hypothetical protein K439DRAFT_1620161 [Ramaria rubella]|nr:hypothetical protein K439DRAFT_1620161 [Ramaria rubella]
MDTYDTDDYTADIQSRVSVASSDWGNVSSSASSSSAENELELAAKDIVNWREFWNIWSSHHPVVTVDMATIPADHHATHYIYSVFRYACGIPRARFNLDTQTGAIPAAVQSFLTQLDPSVFSDGEPDASVQSNGLVIAALALEVHEAALHLIQEGADVDALTNADEQWTVRVHDALIIHCAHGHLGLSEPWSQPSLPHAHTFLDSSPTAARILSIRKIRPHGAIPVSPASPFYAAALCTRAQISSQLRDTLEPSALYSYSTMASRAALAKLCSSGITMPVFGVMLDRNFVRFHVDWGVMGAEHELVASDLFFPPVV